MRIPELAAVALVALVGCGSCDGDRAKNVKGPVVVTAGDGGPGAAVEMGSNGSATTLPSTIGFLDAPADTLDGLYTGLATADRGDAGVLGPGGQREMLGFVRERTNAALIDHSQKEPDDVVVALVLVEKLTGDFCEVRIGETLHGRVVRDASAVSRLGELLAGLSQDLGSGLYRKLRWIPAFEQHLRRDVHDAI